MRSKLQREPDVLIVGAGITGATIADILTEHGFSVALAFWLYKPRVPRDFNQEDFIPPEYK